MTTVRRQLGGDLSVGEVYAEGAPHASELRALIDETSAAAAREIGVTLEPGTFARLSAYGRSVPNFPTAIKEFEWRNGWFYKRSTAAVLAAGGDAAADPTPLHTASLRRLFCWRMFSTLPQNVRDVAALGAANCAD